MGEVREALKLEKAPVELEKCQRSTKNKKRMDSSHTVSQAVISLEKFLNN